VRIELQTVATGITSPVDFLSANDGTGRLFIVSQTGKILILNGGTVSSTAFLDVSSRLVSLKPNYDERGLLSIAFHPGFTDPASPGYRKLYTYTSEPVSGAADFTVPITGAFNHQSVLAEWQVSAANPDVVDVSTLRRGKPSANSVWGDKASVLVGDFLFTRSFELMVDVGSLDILAVLSRASSTIAEGEVLQLVSQRDTSTPEATYLEVIKAKTAKLFAAAAEVGAMVAGRNGPERVALQSFGMNLGIAFQLVDDALDYAGREAQLGKTVGDDFREGKITLPVILAFLRGRTVDREFWKRTIEKLDQRDGDLEQAKILIDRHGALADTLERARHYGAMARDALGLFPDTSLKAALLEAVDFAIDRAH